MNGNPSELGGGDDYSTTATNATIGLMLEGAEITMGQAGFATETWILYGVGLCSVVFRTISRFNRLGIKRFQWDDYLIIFALFWYTLLCVALNEVVAGGGSNLLKPEEIPALTPTTKDERRRGSKFVFLSEHAMLLTLWCLKACMLIIYARLTDGLKQRKYVLWCAIWTGLGFVGSELTLFLACRPLSQYWAVPVDNPQCASYQHYEIVEGIFTITSDIAIMLVGMPVLISVRLPRRQKVALLVLFGLGIFAIISAVLTKVYCLVPELISYVYMRWYYREATVMMLVVNMPLTWSLVGSMFPRLRSWFSNHGSSEIDFFSGGQIRSRARGMSTGEPRARESGIRQQFSLKPLGRRDRPSISINSSQERINRSNPEEQFENGIRKDVTVVLEAGEVGSWVEPETAEVGKAGDKTITTITAGR